MEIVVFDLDGTLVDVTGLEPWMLAERTDFDVYHDIVQWRLPKPEVLEQLHNHVDEGDDIMIVTGRGEEFMQSTLAWLHEHVIPYYGIRMRTIGDTRPGHEVKRDLLEGLIKEDGYVIKKAYEDDPACAKMMETEFGVDVELIPGFPVSTTSKLSVMEERVARKKLERFSSDYWVRDGMGVTDTEGFVDHLFGEMEYAIGKHGLEKTPYERSLDDLKKYVVLAEEVGEVARALTYDEGNKDDLKKELLQVAAMAGMWYMSLRGEDE